MTPYRHLLCPTDFSDLSLRALSWSVELSRSLDAKLTVLHVVDTGLQSIGNLVAVPTVVEELHKRATEEMDRLRERADLGAADVAVVNGSPAETIVTKANESGVDLLVMTTHGASGLQRLLLGSVMEKVLHRVHVPLLTMSESAPEIETRPPEVVLAAVDFGPESQASLRHALWLAEHYGARLLVAHVTSLPYVVLNDRTLERLTPRQLEELTGALTNEKRLELEDMIPETSVPVEILTPFGSAFESLAELVEERSADLVVMGGGGHGDASLGWLGSTCHKMVRAGKCPVLIVR